MAISLRPVLILIALLATAAGTRAQDAQPELQTRFLMLNQHECLGNKHAEAMGQMRDIFAPIFEGLKEDGAIQDWGILTHAWGSEYNLNFYFITENHRELLDAWDAFWERAGEHDPDWYETWAPLCDSHRDETYYLHTYD